MVHDSGAVAEVGRAHDTFDEVKEAILKATEEYDVVITTGGTAISKEMLYWMLLMK